MNLSKFCFKDPILQRHIEKFGRAGDCDVTGKKSLPVVEAGELGSLFKPLLGLYEPFSGSPMGYLDTLEGNTLRDCIEEVDGWGIFSKVVSPETGCAVLDAIRGVANPDGSIWSDEDWIRKNLAHKFEQKEWWDEFTYQLTHHHRFIPDLTNRSVGDPRKVLSKHLDKFKYRLVAGKPLYRARIGWDNAPSVRKLNPNAPLKEMGAPPPAKATAGRANPPGVSYLYVAEQEATAVQEVRAYVGAKVTVARLEVTSDLKLVSVAKIKHVFSPFQHPNLEEILLAYDILSVLNEKLSRPVDPNTSQLDYLPSQYLAEVVLDSGFDGIRYKSAVSEDGVNVVVFDQEKTAILETKLIEVTAMNLKYRDLTAYPARPPKTRVKTRRSS